MEYNAVAIGGQQMNILNTLAIVATLTTALQASANEIPQKEYDANCNPIVWVDNDNDGFPADAGGVLSSVGVCVFFPSQEIFSDLDDNDPSVGDMYAEQYGQ